jgi:hypothetical protein
LHPYVVQPAVQLQLVVLAFQQPDWKLSQAGGSAMTRNSTRGIGSFCSRDERTIFCYTR